VFNIRTVVILSGSVFRPKFLLGQKKAQLTKKFNSSIKNAINFYQDIHEGSSALEFEAGSSDQIIPRLADHPIRFRIRNTWNSTIVRQGTVLLFGKVPDKLYQSYQCSYSGCLSGFFPSRIRNFSIPDPGSASKNLSILSPKNYLQALDNMIRVAHPGSRSWIRILTFYPSRIPDPGVKF
jgi:hypothetical protein